MTKNIGLFTNAGIRVEDATKMIEGFSNVAAASGTNAEGAASALLISFRRLFRRELFA
jgi:hypothetical protein